MPGLCEALHKPDAAGATSVELYLEMQWTPVLSGPVAQAVIFNRDCRSALLQFNDVPAGSLAVGFSYAEAKARTMIAL